MKSNRTAWALAAVAILMLIAQASTLDAGPGRVETVSVDQIGLTVLLIGRLGVQLGQKMEVTGYWHYSANWQAKDDSIRFTVTAVNGKEMKKPVEFNHAQLHFTDKQQRDLIPAAGQHGKLNNQVWTLTAYETGRIQIVPDEQNAETALFPATAMPYYTQPFTSELVGVLQKRNSR